jgi:predicted RNA-binding protein associated with RNAse of E/G family
MRRKHRDTRPEGYYVDSGTYPAMPKSRTLTTDQIFDVLGRITPQVHAATMHQFSQIKPGE